MAPVTRLISEETLFTTKMTLKPRILYLGIVLLLSSSGRGLGNGVGEWQVDYLSSLTHGGVCVGVGVLPELRGGRCRSAPDALDISRFDGC